MLTSVCKGLSSLALWAGKMRDPGNEVVLITVTHLLTYLAMLTSTLLFMVEHQREVRVPEEGRKTDDEIGVSCSC